MQIIDISHPSAIPTAIQHLKQGHLIIYPTETCYGLGVDTTNSQAISKLLQYKGDRQSQVSVAINSLNMAKTIVKLNSTALNLYQEFLPGPITVISQSLHQLDKRLESPMGNLGIRYPEHDFALKLIQKFNQPITATSANTSGKKEPYSLHDWQKYTSLKKQAQVTLFLDAGKLKHRPTSTIVDTTLNDPQILRQGEFILPQLQQHSFISHSPKETQSFATQLLQKHLSLLQHQPLIIALVGELGAGKTQLAKGFAQALHIKTSITSPTYTLMREYSYSLPKQSGIFYHLDTWRLADMKELDSTLNLNQKLTAGNLLVLEWANKANSWLSQQQSRFPLIIVYLKVNSPTQRTFTYSISLPIT